jgi:hypothetical protein
VCRYILLALMFARQRFGRRCPIFWRTQRLTLRRRSSSSRSKCSALNWNGSPLWLQLFLDTDCTSPARGNERLRSSVLRMYGMRDALASGRSQASGRLSPRQSLRWMPPALRRAGCNTSSVTAGSEDLFNSAIGASPPGVLSATVRSRKHDKVRSAKRTAPARCVMRIMPCGMPIRTRGRTLSQGKGKRNGRRTNIRAGARRTALRPA